MVDLAANFREFMFASSMANTSAAYAIGAATAELSKSITFSVLIPTIYAAWGALTTRRLTAPRFALGAVLENLLYWFCVIFVAYFLAEVFFSQGLLGIKTTLKPTELKMLHVAEERAEQDKSRLASAAGSLIGDPIGYAGAQ